MAARRFDEGCAELARRVGDGHLVGSLVRDQAYAQYQHETPLRHPTGGQWKYQEQALYSTADAALGEVARTTLSPGGPAGGMTRGMELIDAVAATLCPKETTVLARSGHVRVLDGGQVVRDRPPKVPRLSDAELRADRRGGRRGR